MNLDDLNPAQRAAVLAPDGPILILAGAGSGKTRVLTYRIAHLQAERKAIPEQTLAVTFTNKAASEMRERVASLMDGASRFPWVSTLHCACELLLRQEIGVLARWQERAAHLLVDEYQDTNHVQYLLVRALSARSGNLCVVGDEDQSIYRWRGADIRNILDFERDYPNAEIFKLEQNYRSTKTILAAADAVIQNNLERKPKRLWTQNPAGELVTYYTGMTERDEADYVAREIARLVAGGEFQAADIVVFYRVNAQSRVL